ncbi:hypothetical protein [Methylobacterium sp. AMS5]|uniref:hypothetical protein n=1 Tax=Methylobacterium sp. AMS5 TaxID=925818 RepID=UPI00074FA194|nr:hypothetical protein [Methylobacterium sp. AMS5]AMB48320.1 hypothetical protein Y590_25465 [Methylobacterium sp. AMS5]
MQTDHEGEELHPVHVLPYKIVSDEYGDYAYTKKHDTGELVAVTLPELAEKLRALAVEHVLGWAKGSKDAWDRLHLPEPHYLERFKYDNLDRHRCYTDFAGKIARSPANGLTYIEIGTYRIELRREYEAVPELPSESHGFETVIPALETALVETRERLGAAIAQRKEAARAAAEADKRAQLARLKAELGES